MHIHIIPKRERIVYPIMQGVYDGVIVARAYLRHAESRYKRLLYNAGCSVSVGKIRTVEKGANVVDILD